MAQVSYGTITITDTNDIEEIFSLYGGSNDANTSPAYTYAAVTGGTIWKRNVTAITNYKYIWQITAITKTGIIVDSSNWQQFYGVPIRITGEEGDDARNIITVTPYYYLSSSDSSQTGGNWSTSPQAYPSTGVYYYWTKTITTYDSGSPSESTPVLDMFLTNAAKDARDANATAAIANSIAQHANENAQGAMSQSTETQYQTDLLKAKVKNFWWDSNGAHIASGVNGADVTKETISTYGYNALTALGGISFKYNDAKVVDLNSSTPSLDFYKPPTISNNGSSATAGAKTMSLTSNSLNFYGSSTSTADATLTSTGLLLSKGGIESGSLSSGNGYVYLSTEDKAGITINGHSPGNADPKWRAIIGSKFGVDSEGNLYASNATISGAITVGSGSVVDGSYITTGTIQADRIKASVISAVNNSTETYNDEPLTISADKINVEGATIFTTGRLSTESLNETYTTEDYVNNTNEELQSALESQINVKKSIHTLITGVSNTYSNLSEIAAEGNIQTWTIQNLTEVVGIAVGDSVRLQCSISNMNNAPAYIIGTILEINGNSISVESHGLDSTVIYGGNILANSITAQNIDMDNLQTAFARIGDSNSFHIKIDGTELGFYDKQTKVAYLRNNQLFINQSVVVQQMDVGLPIGMEDPTTHKLGKGQWSWKVHANASGQNNLNLRWMG